MHRDASGIKKKTEFARKVVDAAERSFVADHSFEEG
jgi:hypothetical protein